MKLIKLCSALCVIILCFGCGKLSVPPLKDIGSPPVVTPNIVILGSSTAAGTGANPIDSAWAFRLQATVNKTSKKANFINLAVGNYTTYHVMPSASNIEGRPAPDTARNITKALSYKPSLVILSFPSNDIAFNYSDDEILHNYAVLTHLLDSAKVQYIIFSTQPRNFTDVNQRMRLGTLNDKINSVYTYHTNDFLNALSVSNYMINPIYSSGDGIHLNNAGHAVIYNATLKHPLFLKYLN